MDINVRYDQEDNLVHISTEKETLRLTLIQTAKLLKALEEAYNEAE